MIAKYRLELVATEHREPSASHQSVVIFGFELTMLPL
jgi:hypothetical protein